MADVVEAAEKTIKARTCLPVSASSTEALVKDLNELDLTQPDDDGESSGVELSHAVKSEAPLGTGDGASALISTDNTISYHSIFKEIIDIGSPYPTEEELEHAGVFDLELPSLRLQEYRQEVDSRASLSSSAKFSPRMSFASARPMSPSNMIETITSAYDSTASHHRMSIESTRSRQHDHLISRATSPKPPSISSPRLSPLGAFVRKAMRPIIPHRTQSTSDIPSGRTVSPLVSPLILDSPATNPWDRAMGIASEPARKTNADENRLPSHSRMSLSASTSKLETGSEKRNESNYRARNSLSTLPIPTIRTDQAYLDSQQSSGHSSPLPTSAESSKSKKWRRSLPFASSSSSPRSDQELDLPNLTRSRSPTGSFPSSVRREGALTPIENRSKRRESTSSSDEGHYGDGESNSRSRRSSLTSPSATKSPLWTKALQKGRSHSSASHQYKKSMAKQRRPSNHLTSDDDGWALIHLEESSSRSSPVRSFEVVRRPQVGRTQSDQTIPSQRSPMSTSDVLSNIAASNSSPNLSQIDEEDSHFGAGSASKRSSSTRIALKAGDEDMSINERRSRTHSANTLQKDRSRPTTPSSSALNRVATRDSTESSDEDDARAKFHSPHSSPGRPKETVNSNGMHSKASSSSLSDNQRERGRGRRSGTGVSSESEFSTYTGSSAWERDDDGNYTPASSTKEISDSDREENGFATSVVHRKPLESIPVDGENVVGWT